MPYKVLKPIPNGDGSYHATGDVVAAEGWRNLRQLINGRYLVEVLAAAPAAAPIAIEDAAEAPQPKRKRKTFSADAE